MKLTHLTRNDEHSDITQLRGEVERLRQDVAFLRQLLYQVRLEFQQHKR
jgi:hypothetical protein